MLSICAPTKSQKNQDIIIRHRLKKICSCRFYCVRVSEYYVCRVGTVQSKERMVKPQSQTKKWVAFSLTRESLGGKKDRVPNVCQKAQSI